jgi:hypothetical protein
LLRFRRVKIVAIMLSGLLAMAVFHQNGINAAASDAKAAISSDAGRAFAIQRNGEDIGRHEMRFERIEGRLNVRIKVSVDYRILFIPVYRFRHKAHEVWVGGALQALRATTDDNGDAYDVAVQGNGAALTLSVNGEETDIQHDAVLTSLWREDMAREGQMIDPADGEVMEVQVTGGDGVDISVRGETIRAQHYIMTGGLDRELWYDSQGLLVKVRFTGEDGSVVQFRML